MSAPEKRYRRNFIVAIVLHIGIIAGIVMVEQLPSFGDHTEPPPTFVEADILGELPEGSGSGRGAYRAPEPEEVKAQLPAAQNSSSDETAAPEVKRSAPVKAEADEIAVPTKRKKVVAKTPATVKTSPARKPVVAAAHPAASTGTSRSSVADIRRRFASALASESSGTAGGDNKAPGGGKGRGSEIGSPSGSRDGVAGGVGQGSENWQYFRQVHDALYEAWEQPDSAVDKKLMTTVALRVARDGSIEDASVRIGSGSRSMDDSVLAAVRKVPRLEPPPDSLVRGEYAVITVNFQAEG